MKKNIMMKIASVLLIAVLLTTCVISGTFAKYVTSADDADQARVAKWGVEVAVAAEDAFALKYNDAAAADGVKVVSSTTEDVVAPGTNGTLATASVTGKPEVMVNVVPVVDLALTGWEVDGTTCPLVFNVNGTEFKVDGSSIANAAALETAVEDQIIGIFAKTNVAANTDLATSLNVTWSWAFNDAEDAISENDTALGNLATAPTIDFTLEITVSQVD